ncbi:hypothetical protein OHA98_13020 [Streptomyces sp. NBC_00654]|uniref:COG4315 family predicted lipoprotein n=1 Tax=Streptomyces sp. NBC_00654 TaxID=2975799 RepID=UPI0022584330|nr:hypothetical protein [Streptomyces sp. NBC_00654]MCX4965746.1 hypothetical protein [Streptomyces sp. NBC_00654]
MRSMVRKAAAVAVVALFATAATGCGDSNSGGSSSSASPSASRASASASASGTSAAAAAGTVATTTGPLGTHLVDGDGRTLYLFEADTSTKSTCTGTCAAAWPPFTVTGQPVAGKGVKAGLLGTTTRSDGNKEVTYNGHPLYHFGGDTKAGDTNGQGSTAFGAAWYVVDPSGARITAPASPTGKPSGGGY